MWRALTRATEKQKHKNRNLSPTRSFMKQSAVKKEKREKESNTRKSAQNRNSGPP